MKLFWLKLIIFTLPFIALAFIDLYILPEEYFTFRTWEIVSYNRFDNLRIGPFYPSVRINKLEEGNLGHDSKYAIAKEVEWITDKYGYRNYENKGHETLVLGDSNIAGATLDQKDTFTEVLEDMIDGDVYSMGQANINDYLLDRRFVNNPPKRVIMASIRILPDIDTKISPKYGLKERLKENNIIKNIIIKLDKLLKFRMINYINSAFQRTVNKFFNEETIPEIGFVNNDVLFLKLKYDYYRKLDSDVAKATNIIKKYNDYFTSHEIEFIFLPIPNKRDIYHDLIPQEKKSNFVPLLIDSLSSEGIKVIDIYTSFEEAYQNDENLYHIDDTHWNKQGVYKAAKATAEIINNTN
ncbi:MAG: hypothetical protein WCS88_04305 [Patescibacteria group bacterium]|jgi:hypothetical protein